MGSDGSAGQSFTLPFDTVVDRFTFGTLAGAGPAVNTYEIRNATGTVMASGTVSVPGPTSAAIFNISPVFLAAGEYHFKPAYISGIGWTHIGATNNPYPGGCSKVYATSSCSGNLNDLVFTVESADTYASGTVQITSPQLGQETYEFDFWGVHAIPPAAESLVLVSYSASSTLLWSASSTVDATFLSVPAAFTAEDTFVVRTGVICVTENDCPRTMYAQAKLVSTDQTTEYTSSTIISFTTLFSFRNARLPGEEPPEDEACSSGDVVADAVCRSVRWLFYPSPTSLSQWSGLWSAVKNKPPFGYGTSVVLALQSFSTSTTSTFALAPELADLPFWDPIKTVISFLLYLLGIFWTFNRARHFEF